MLDIGSNSVHLLVVDAHRGGHPTPAYSEKSVLRLAENLTSGGKLSTDGEDTLTEVISSARQNASRLGCDDLLAFATSALRDAKNGSAVLRRITRNTGVELQVLDGRAEAQLTFLAQRRWFGWSSGRLLSLDIGGGSLELAVGDDEEPEVALSLPLGAGRLTRGRLHEDPPRAAEVDALRSHVARTLKPAVRQLTQPGPARRAVASSKTFRSLARLAGAAPSGRGQHEPRELTREGLHQVAAFVARIAADKLAELDGVSAARAHQLLAGSVVAEEAMRQLDLDRVDISPWALREGVILRRLDWIDGM